MGDAMDPYKELGLDKDATPKDIKNAYRKRAKETHPDVTQDGGEKFDRVKNAYMILSDPERREKYDSTGSTEEKRKAPSAYDFLAGLLNEILEKDPPDNLDILDMMRETVKGSIAHIDEDKKVREDKNKRHENRLRRLKVKAKKKGVATNFFELALRNKIQMNNDSIRRGATAKVNLNAALKLLDDYEFISEDDVSPASYSTTMRVRIKRSPWE